MKIFCALGRPQKFPRLGTNFFSNGCIHLHHICKVFSEERTLQRCRQGMKKPCTDEDVCVEKERLF